MSVMTEVVSDHSWSTAMNDATRAHQSEQRSFDPHYRTPSSHSSRRTPSQSSRRSLSSTTSSTPAPRSSHATPQSSDASHNSSKSASSQPQLTSTPAPTPQDQPPSPPLPAVDANAASHTPSSIASSTAPASLTADPSQRNTKTAPRRMKVESLQHIRDLAGTDMGASAARPADDGTEATQPPQYDISAMNPMEIIEMVAGLLTKITTTNDEHYDYLHRSIPPPDATASLSPQTTSVWAFHGKNVPSITILSYLGRIQKYCPATYEVFLSLLVYFDRMTERVNSDQMQSLRQANEQSLERSRFPSGQHSSQTSTPAQADVTPPYSGSRSPQNERQIRTSTLQSSSQHAEPPSPPLSDSDPTNLSSFFVVDSFNIHRLVIAGVTCAAKFFSDVFFTNSRYAKVGGLPLIELNHLELQFLLLNDFRLAIPVEELEQYGTMLVEFYAREIVAQRQTENDNANVIAP